MGSDNMITTTTKKQRSTFKEMGIEKKSQSDFSNHFFSGVLESAADAAPAYT